MTLVLVGALATPVLAKDHKHKHKEPGQEVKWKDVPVAVQTSLQTNAAGGKITRVGKETKKGAFVYIAEVKTTDGNFSHVTVTDTGKLLGVKAEKHRPKPKHFLLF